MARRSFFQSASLLGYCLFPINVASFVMIFIESWLPPIFKLAIVVASFLWATLCNW
jgi:protein YIPF6